MASSTGQSYYQFVLHAPAHLPWLKSVKWTLHKAVNTWTATPIQTVYSWMLKLELSGLTTVSLQQHALTYILEMGQHAVGKENGIAAMHAFKFP